MSETATKPRRAPEPPPPPPPPPRAPAARVRRSRGISLIWLVPLVAAAIAGWLAFTTWRSEGARIRLTFETAEGLDPGKTKIKFREVDVGTIEQVRLSPDLKRIVVTARMASDAGQFLTKGTRFWIVRPRVGTGGVSGLTTLVSGAYIGVDPGPGDYTTDFEGLEEPPQISSDVPGRRFVLRADRLGSLGAGAPIYYRGIEVGQVLGYDLLPGTAEALKINVFVRKPYDSLVRDQTRFWNASGLTVGTGGGGFQVRMATLQALLVGGVEFETSSGAAQGREAAADAEFYLFPNADAADQADYNRGQPYLVEFDASTRGLQRRAPVEVRGVRVGSVSDTRLAFDTTRQVFVTQATIEVDPKRLAAVDAATGQPVTTGSLEELVAQGLRAQLQTGNLLTGDLYVGLDFQPGAEKAELRTVGGLKVIPSVPTQLESLQASATQLLQSVSATAKTLEATVTSPETKAAIANLGATMESLRSTMDGLDKQAGPMIASLKASSDVAAGTLRQAQETFASLGPGSPISASLQSLIGELQNAARSIRGLSDYLERHPEALLRGKPGGY